MRNKTLEADAWSFAELDLLSQVLAETQVARNKQVRLATVGPCSVGNLFADHSGFATALGWWRLRMASLPICVRLLSRFFLRVLLAYFNDCLAIQQADCWPGNTH